MPQLFTNNARALLTGAITDTATSLTVEAAKADLFPAANTGANAVPAATDWFKATLQNAMGETEIVYVRTRTAGVMSDLLRGQEGTTARAFSAGDVCGVRITAADIQGAATKAGTALQPGDDVPWSDLSDIPAAFPPSAHGHTVGDVSGLQAALDGKQTSATVLANTTASFTIAQETKLAGVATGATANSTDAQLRDRSTHTGTQTAATIIDFAAAVAATAAVAANTAKVSNATHTGDATGSTELTLATVNSNVGSFGLASSVAQFVVNAKGLITSAADVAISIASTAINDSTAAGRSLLTAATAAAQRTLLNVADGATANSTDAQLRDRSTHTGTQLAATISDFSSAVAATTAVDRLRSLSAPTTGGTGTLVIGDRGANVKATGGITIPASVFAAEDVVTITNTTAGDITLTSGAGLTLYQVGTANTGNRTLAQRGMATVVFVSATVAYISGGGLT